MQLCHIQCEAVLPVTQHQMALCGNKYYLINQILLIYTQHLNIVHFFNALTFMKEKKNCIFVPALEPSKHCNCDQ